MDRIKVGYLCVRDDCRDLVPPKVMTDGASGVDIAAAVDQPMTLRPGETKAIPTGMQLEIPVEYEAQVRPRSGLALHHSVGVLNSPGTIDSDYRGEVLVILTNFGKKDFVIQRGDRIAQLVFQRVVQVEFESKDDLTTTDRGSGGFGHTGQ